MPEMINLQPIIAQFLCSVLISDAELFHSVEKIKYEKSHFPASGTG